MAQPSDLSDLGDVINSVSNTRNDGISNGKPSIMMFLMKQPEANIVDTVERVKAIMPQLRASIPPSIKLDVLQDRTTTIRAAIDDVEDRC